MPRSSSLQQELNQAHPFASLEQEALIGLYRTAFVLRRRGEALMQEHGITSQQYNVLRILRGAGEPLPTMEVAARMIEPEPGITRMMRRLERKEFIERTPCQDDARRVLCGVTEKGLQVLRALDVPVSDLNNQLLHDLDEDQLTTFITLLDQIRANASSGMAST